MRTLALLTLVSLLTYSESWAQSFIPKNLGREVNSAYDEINPVLSPDGRQLFFVRVNHPENTYGQTDSEDIWYSERINDSTWTTAKRLPNLNIGRYNAVLGFINGGMLINGVFNKNATMWKKRGLSIATKTGSNWGMVEPLKVKKLGKINRGLKSSATVSSDGETLIFSFSKKYNGKKSDLFISNRKTTGVYGKPKKIKELSTSAAEETPFLGKKNEVLYFSSDRSGTTDIYQARLVGDSWSKPTPLSDSINSSYWDSYYRTNCKGSWAFFSSSSSGLGKADIFTVKVYEENPVVVVTGFVIDGRSGKPLLGKNAAVLVNGRIADSVRYNKDSASYRLKLPLGKTYSLSTNIQHYTSTPGMLDVSALKEFSKRSLNLVATPLPYVVVRGKILVQDTGAPLSPIYQPKVLINNQIPDSLQLDVNASTYEIKLLHGKRYELRAEAAKHESLSQALDLTAVSSYQELTQNLYLLENKMAVVKGRILDKKTNEILAKLALAKINVEGLSSVFASIDTLTGEYELKLPLGSSYTISASAPNYYPLYESVNLLAEKTDVKIFKDLIIVPIEVGQSIRLNNIFFDPGKAVLKAESFPELDRVSIFLSQNESIKIEIAGHTDNVGKAETNLKLSQNRAQAVADYLLKKGMAKERVVAKGYGLAKPVASNTTKEGKAQNRRVEFTVLDN